MKPRSLLRHVAFWPVLFAGSLLLAQLPSPDGSNRHPSDLRYPLNTWARPEPLGFALPIKGRTTVSTSIYDKLQSIVIPRIEFRRTTLRDAVEFLYRESRQLDPDPDPDRRGVKILGLPEPSPVQYHREAWSVEAVFGLPLTQPPRPAEDFETRITLTLERLPLLEALRYVASQAGAKVIVEPDGVSIVPADYEIRALNAAQYEVPPELLGRPAKTSVDESPVDLKNWFKARGIKFPPGSLAVYEPFSRKLIVCNTQENLDKIVSVISSALKPTDPEPTHP